MKDASTYWNKEGAYIVQSVDKTARVLLEFREGNALYLETEFLDENGKKREYTWMGTPDMSDTWQKK